MSEYQYYEFAAMDRPLDERELAQIRAVRRRGHRPAARAPARELGVSFDMPD